MLFRNAGLLAILLSISFTTQSIAQEDLTIYLFRHAETTGTGSDRTLSEDGKDRAYDLLTIINEKNVDQLYSTDLNRTIQTIAPFSKYYDLEIQFYDHRDLEGLADQLRSSQGVLIVSGHSNTTPELASLLTGEEIPPIDESEYDNLYIIKFIDNLHTLSILKIPPFYQSR